MWLAYLRNGKEASATEADLEGVGNRRVVSDKMGHKGETGRR